MGNKLLDILPKFYEYKIDTYIEDESNNFDATFKVNLFNEVSVKSWLKQFEQCSLTNFRVARTAPAKKTRVLFKKYYRCHHNTRASETASKTKKAHMKHTGCEATLLITVNNSTMKNCKQPDVKHFPCTVKYHNFHNHPLSSDELLCHRKPLERIENKIRQLLLKNHTPVSALKILKQDLQQEFKDEYSEIVKDGAFCPKLQWIYHKYYSIFKEMCTDPCKIQYFSSDLIDEREESDPENENYHETDLVPAGHSASSANNYSISGEDDVPCEEFILSAEDELLFENRLIEVYTIDKSDEIETENDNIFTHVENIADMPLIEDGIIDENYNELTNDNDLESEKKSILPVDEKVVILNVEDVYDQHSSKQWEENIHRKDIELNEGDLGDILNADIFLPSIKDEMETYGNTHS